MVAHSCIKCKKQYQDNDPDDYYCEECNIERKKIAAEVDKKVRPRKKVMSAYQQYEAAPKVNGRFMHVKL